MKFVKSLATGAAMLLASTAINSAYAESLDYYMVDGVTYNNAITKPADILGHDIGDQPSRHDLMVRFIETVAAQSDRMTIETIGYSHENRPILTLIVTHPDNHARIDEIRAAHLKRTSAATAAEASDDLPVITWLNYGVHGAEASGMEAAIPTVYHLAAAQGAEIEEDLKNSVVVLTAVFNPDGHSRRANWITSYGSDVVITDPDHEMHNHRWPGGRTNHYWFDLNRQWLLQSQPESRAWLTQWHKWKPEVTVDYHEMGRNATYYFHPGVPTRKYPLIPSKGRELLYELAGYHSEWLDSEKQLYFTEEGYDNFYVGKGSTYPQVNGGLGVLFEAGAQMGIAAESDQGVKTYARNIRDHFRTSLTSIAGAADMREKLHAYQRDFFLSAQDLAKEDKVKGYVFRAPEDPERMNMFLDLLKRHHIDTYRVKGSIKADGKTYGDESYIVPLAQDQYRMAKSMFNKITEFPDRVFYDVSGWTLPAAYGLDFAEVTGSVSAKLGDAAEITRVASVPERAPYAYVFRWSDYYAPRALNRLLQAGIMARVAIEPMEVATTNGVVKLDRGGIIVSQDRQTVSNDDIYDVIKTIAAEDGITVHAATSGRTLTPGTDLGGRNNVRDLKAPHVLLVTGPGVAVSDAGEVWHLLDHKMKVPVSLVRKERLSSLKDMGRYTHIVLVGGYNLNLDKSFTADLKDWVKDGGTIIGHRQGAQWIAQNVVGVKKDDKKDDSSKPVRLTYADKGQNDARHVVGGAVFASNLDITHPMGFGYVRDEVYTHRNTTLTLPVPKDPYAQVAVYGEAPLVSGYVSDKRLGEIKGTPMMTAERLGRGSVILFADNPAFRSTYIGAEKMFMNAIFMSKVFLKARGPGDEEEMEMEAEE
ncbi:peptidase M14 [Kordiimonas sediminis]|uniref:Peptidase M14 n=1 Tax=Kordiimonas sediminis TaxID=1735581 RepID=A0A919ANJ4_9PROT|nr:M14 family zinc carboxypeptidase [Kordiimonas sediminis]GHF17143.1 peptidase M14 [Kordiimonas sediminis]